MQTKATFLNAEEKLAFYSARSSFNPLEYPSKFTLKVFSGVEIMIYHFTEFGELRVDTILKMTNFTATDRGIKLAFIDLKSHDLFSVGEIPNLFAKYDVLSHIPYSCYVERTVKLTQGGRHLQGIATAMALRTKSSPKDSVTGHNYVMMKSQATRSFETDELDFALARWEAGVDDA